MQIGRCRYLAAAVFSKAIAIVAIFLAAGVLFFSAPSPAHADYNLRTPDIAEVNAWPGYAVQLNDEVIVTADSTDNSVWYSFIPLRSGDYIFDTCDEGTQDTYMSLYQANDPDDYNELILLDENDNTGSPCTNSGASRIDQTLTAGEKYYVQIDLTEIGDVRFVLHSDDPAVELPSVANTNDWPGYTLQVDDSFVVDNTTADIEVSEPKTDVLFNSIWFSFTPGTTGTYAADTCADTSPDTYLALYQPGDPNLIANLELLAENDDTEAVCSNAQSSRIESTLNAGTTYYFQVGGSGVGNTGPITFHFSDVPAGVADELTLDQVSLFSTSAGNFSFTGTASTSDLVQSTQWRQYVAGQDPAAGWTTCTPQDGTFDEATESYTCAIPTGSTDGQFHFEITATSMTDATVGTVYPTALLDLATNIDYWLNFTNSTNIGTHAGASRSYGTVSLTGTPSLTSGLYNDGALSFDGTDQFSIIDDTPYLDYAGTDRSFSLSARFWPATAGDNTERTLFVKNWPGTPNTSFWSLKINDDNSIAASIRIGAVHNTLTTTEDSISLDEWHAVTVAYDVEQRVMCVKIDSQRAKCQAWIQTEGVYPSDYPLLIGTDFIGLIDDIVIRRSADVTPPVTSIAGLDNADRVTTATPTFTASFSDVGGGVASADYCVTWPSNTCDDWHAIATPADGSWGGTSESANITIPSQADGEYTISVRATDTQGNASVDFYYYTSPFFQASYTFTVETVDTTSPRIYTNAIAPDPGSETRPIIRGYVKDYLVANEGDTISNITGISYSIDDGAFVPIEPIDGNYNSSREDFYYRIPADLEPGSHTVQIRATDSASNSTAENTVNTETGDARISFTVAAASSLETAQSLSSVITFDDHDLHDSIYSDAVWGNGIVRLRQKIDFTETIDYDPASNDIFGYTFGASYVGVFPSTDGNMWIAGNDGSITYYNSDTQSATVYSKTLLQGTNTTINKVFEFVDSSNRYLLISYSSGTSTIIYDIKNTPENTADDSTPAVQISDVPSVLTGYSKFVGFGTDTREEDAAIYGMIEGTANNVMRLNLNSTPMNVSDDTFVVWGQAEGSAVDGVGSFLGSYNTLYFDQASHLFIGAHYTGGMFICDDNNTPVTKADDDCSSPLDSGAVAMGGRVFSIIKDPNGWYWFGGDNGIQMVNLNGTQVRSDDTVRWIMESADISSDSISSLAWVAGEYPVGDEVWAMTRQGRIRAVEYNSTYADVADDTTYKYKIDSFDFRAGGSSTFFVQDGNTVWVPVPGVGLDKVTLARSFEDLNTIEIYPSTPGELLEVNHFLLESVIGSVSSGSVYNFGDLVTYQISNDAGVTWSDLAVGEITNFTDSNYKLKLKVILHKGSTPIIESLSLSYTAQPQGTIAEEAASGNSSSSNQIASVSTGTASSGDCGESLPADAPDLFEIRSTNTRATLYLTPPSGDYTSFYVGYGEDPEAIGHGFQFAHGKSSGVISTTIDHLKPNTTYYFKIRSGRGCAAGTWSNRMTIRTTAQSDSKKTYYRNTIVKIVQTVKKFFNKGTADTAVSETKMPTILTPEPTQSSEKGAESAPATPEPEKKKTCFLWWCW